LLGHERRDRDAAFAIRAEQPDRNEREPDPGGEDREQRGVAAGPFDTRAAVLEDAEALDRPEGAERREQETDGELDRVLGDARERLVQREPGNEHDRATD